MEALMEENSVKKEKTWCKLIAYQPYDLIVLEDLTVKGYSTISRKKMLDLDHATVAVKALGRFHAMSRVLLNRGVLDKDEFQPYALLKSDSAIDLTFMITLRLMAESVSTKWGSEWIEIGKKITEECKNVPEKLKQLLEVDDKRFNVVNHGDCWTNNMMFKHGPNNKPMAVKFIDFQIIHYNSFAWDLTYFIFNSIQPKIRRENKSLIISTYYDSLNECLLKYETPEKDIPTLEQINEEMDRMNYFGIVLLCAFFPTMSADSTDAFDFEKYEAEGDSSTAVNKNIYSSVNYINNIKDDLRSYFK